MRHFKIFAGGSALFMLAIVIAAFSRDNPANPKAKAPDTQNSITLMKKSPAEKNVAPAAAPAAAKGKQADDTLVIIARLIEIPGKFPPNDLYNYVYIMKYRVITVVKGSYAGREILVGHYNPLIPRKQIRDKMMSQVKGDVGKFEVNAQHRLVLITPIERVWKDAVEDDYSDSDEDKYFALKAYNVQ